MWDLMLEYLKTGRLGPFYLGQARRDVIKLLGPPDWVNRSEDLEGFTYDHDLSLTFRARRLCNVGVPMFTRPSVLPEVLGPPSPQRLGARSLRRVLTDLRHAGIEVTGTGRGSSFSPSVMIQAASGVALTFRDNRWTNVSQSDWPSSVLPFDGRWRFHGDAGCRFPHPLGSAQYAAVFRNGETWLVRSAWRSATGYVVEWGPVQVLHVEDDLAAVGGAVNAALDASLSDVPSEVFRAEMDEDVVDPYARLVGVDRKTFYTRADLVEVDRMSNGAIRLISTGRREAIGDSFPDYVPVGSLAVSARDAADDTTLGQAIQRAFSFCE